MQDSCITIWSMNENNLMAGLDDYRLLLSDPEQERAQRFHFGSDRDKYTLYHAALRIILAEVVGVAPNELSFSFADKGKPYLTDFPNIHFNLSHAGKVAVLAVADIPIGIDVEWIKAKQDCLALARRFFHPHEADYLEKLSPNKLLNSFFGIWVAKEAFVKTSGAGVSFGLDKFCIQLTDARPVVAWLDEEKGLEDKSWQMHYLPTAKAYLGCICYQGERNELVFKEYSL
jgi:4'-phosphopantetheinyl transferase